MYNAIKPKKMRLPKLITNAWLTKLGACSDGLTGFTKQFPNGMVPSKENLEKLHDDDIDWFAGQVFTKINDNNYRELGDDYFEYILNHTTWPNRKLQEQVAKLPKGKAPKQITLSYLQTIFACSIGQSQFNNLFPGGIAASSEENLAKFALSHIYWLGYQFCRNYVETRVFLDKQYTKIYKLKGSPETRQQKMAQIVMSLVTVE